MIYLVIPLALLSAAAPPADLYNTGNRAYAERNYTAAITAYEQALHTTKAAALHYNLGNAYFKAGSFGKAIASFRRARFLAPRDPDIIYNLRFARQYRLDRAAAATSPVAELISAWLHFFSYCESFMLAAVLFLLCAGNISLYWSFRKKIFAYMAIPLVVAFLFFGVVCAVWHGERTGRYAVIVVAESHAASGPGSDYKDILLLHDGSEVQVKDERGDYFLVQLPGGLGGWVNAQAVEFLYP